MIAQTNAESEHAREQNPVVYQIRRNTLFRLAALLVIVLMLEGLGQLLFAIRSMVRPTSVTGQDCAQENDALCDHQPFQRDQLRALQTDPFTARAWIPGYEGDWLSINSLGFRGEDISLEKQEGVYRIVVVGGSAVVGVGVHDDQTLTAYLQEDLTERLDHPVEVINAGMTGFNSSQELSLIATRVLDLDPDLIIVYDGYNDLFFSMSPFWEPHYTKGVRAAQSPVVTPQEFARTFNEPVRPAFRDTVLGRFLITKSALGRITNRVISEVTVYLPHRNRLAGTVRSPAVRPSSALEYHPEGLDIYERNLIGIAALAERNQVDLLFVVQPTLAAGGRVPTELELAYIEAARRSQNYFDLLSQHYADLIATAQAAGDTAGVPVVDMTSLFDNTAETVYLDGVHLNATGNQMAAQELADIIVADFSP